jgi:hypothetical protein
MSQMSSGDFIYEEPKSKSNTLGLVGFILAFCVSPIGLLLSLIGLTKSPRGFAIAGVIVGLIGTAIWAVVGYGFYVAGTAAIQAKKSADALTAVQVALESSKTPAGEYPADLTGISGNTDAYGNAFDYERAPDTKGYLLTSKGKDGQRATADDVSTMQGMPGDLNVILASFGAGGEFFGGAGGGQAGQALQLASHMMLLTVALQNEQNANGGKLPDALEKVAGMPASLLRDPWGTPYVYTLESDGKAYSLRSNGPDKVAGTQDDMDSKKVTGNMSQVKFPPSPSKP